MDEFSKKALIVNYPGLCIGGIEKYLHTIMKLCLQDNIKVIWITTKKEKEAADFKDVSENDKLNIVYRKPGVLGRIFGIGKLPLNANDDAIMFSVTIPDFIQGEILRKRYRINSFYSFLYLMNFFGTETYPEDGYKSGSALNKLAKYYFTNISKKLAKIDSVRAFSKKQITTFINRYSLDISDPFDKVLKRYTSYKTLTDDEIINNARARADSFNIVTCTRFDFPHKGYLFGLFDEYSKLIKKYPERKFKLRIIGYGDDEQRVIEAIEQLPAAVRNTIEFCGKVNPDDLCDVIRGNQLSIGLSGSALACAATGLPTYIVRHDSYTCDAYGLYHEFGTTQCSDPGKPILPMIERILNCSDDEYINLAKAEIEYYNKSYIYDPYYILRQKNTSSRSPFTLFEIFKSIMWCIIFAVYKRLDKEKNELK